MRTIVTKTNKNNTTTRGEQPSRTTRVTDEITEDGANVTLIETGTGSDATGTTDGAATLTDAATMSDTLRDATDAGPTGMRVTKRNGAVEPVDLNKIVNAIARASEGLLGVDPMRVATRTISALADGATTRELDELSIRTAAGLIVEEPNYSKLAARLLATYVDKEVRNQNIPWFSESVALGHESASSATRSSSSSTPTPPSSTPRSTPTATALRVLRSAHRVRPLPAAPPRDAARSSRRRSTSSCAWPAACRTRPLDEAIRSTT